MSAALKKKPKLKIADPAKPRDGVKREAAELGREFVRNVSLLLSRTAHMRTGMDPDGRDLNEECGYPLDPDASLFREYYDREGIATRVVDVYPSECWSIYPALYETEEKKVTKFERAWNEFEFTHNPWYYLHRIDELSGIGQFGVMLLGINDGRNLDQPARFRRDAVRKSGTVVENADPSRQLLYMQTFAQDRVTIAEINNNPKSPRYKQPRMYRITVDDFTDADSAARADGDGFQHQTLDVHWTRVIHVADNCKDSRVLGVPRQQPVLNRLWDLRKILGGSAEMFWRGAFPGYAFTTQPGVVDDSKLDEESIEEQFKDYSNKLKRYLALSGMDVESLDPQIADPMNHMLAQIQCICTTIGVPIRIFMGSEAAHLASTQDIGTWNRRLSRRQMMYLNPMLIRPFVTRLMALGILPPVARFITEWKDLNAMSDKERADVALKKAQAIQQFVTGGGETVMGVEDFLGRVLGYPEDEVKAIMNNRSSDGGMKTKQVWMNPTPGPSGGARKGNPPRAKVGRP